TRDLQKDIPDRLGHQPVALGHDDVELPRAHARRLCLPPPAVACRMSWSGLYRLAVPSVDEAGLSSGCHRLQLGMSPELLEDATHVSAHRAVADAELPGDQIVVHPLRHEVQHLALPRGEIGAEACLLFSAPLR